MLLRAVSGVYCGLSSRFGAESNIMPDQSCSSTSDVLLFGAACLAVAGSVGYLVGKKAERASTFATLARVGKAELSDIQREILRQDFVPRVGAHAQRLMGRYEAGVDAAEERVRRFGHGLDRGLHEIRRGAGLVPDEVVTQRTPMRMSRAQT